LSRKPARQPRVIDLVQFVANDQIVFQPGSHTKNTLR
jgi:hypothetical protein